MSFCVNCSMIFIYCYVLKCHKNAFSKESHGSLRSGSPYYFIFLLMLRIINKKKLVWMQTMTKEKLFLPTKSIIYNLNHYFTKSMSRQCSVLWTQLWLTNTLIVILKALISLLAAITAADYALSYSPLLQTRPNSHANSPTRKCFQLIVH